MRVVEVTGSTNADLVAEASQGATGPRVLAARCQTSGRGRLERSWASPPGGSLSLSVLWQPDVPQVRWTWVPMVVGLGVLDGLRRLGVEAGLKWPNDVVVGDAAAPVSGAYSGLRKLAGILVEVVPGAHGPCLVAGVGLNLGQDEPGLPVPAATSLRLLTGTAPSFEEVLDAVSVGLQARLGQWQAAGGDVDGSGVAADYRAACTTIGRMVVVRARTAEHVVAGRVVDVASDGSLLLDPGTDGTHGTDGTDSTDSKDRTGAALLRVSVGDVEHLR